MNYQNYFNRYKYFLGFYIIAIFVASLSIITIKQVYSIPLSCIGLFLLLTFTKMTLTKSDAEPNKFEWDESIIIGIFGTFIVRGSIKSDLHVLLTLLLFLPYVFHSVIKVLLIKKKKYPALGLRTKFKTWQVMLLVVDFLIAIVFLVLFFEYLNTKLFEIVLASKIVICTTPLIPVIVLLIKLYDSKYRSTTTEYKN